MGTTMTDDSNSQQLSDKPDGAVTEAPETLTIEGAIARADRMAAQRHELGGKYDKALGEIKDLKAAMAAKPPVAQAAPVEHPTDTMPSWASELSSKVEELGEKLAGYNTRRRDDTRAAFLNKVPEEHREDAGLMLDGMVMRGTIDLTDPSAVDTALSKLNPNLLRDPSRPSPLRAPQKLADDKLDWSAFKSWSDIPQDYRSRVPDEVADRLSRSGGANGARNPFSGGRR